MWKLFTKFSFWLPLLSIIICLFNLLGYDDKNLLLGYTNPLLLLFSKELTKLHYSMESEQSFYFIWYLMHFATFLLIALIVDWIISRIKRAR